MASLAKCRTPIILLAIIGVGLFLSGLVAALIDIGHAHLGPVSFALAWLLASPHTFTYIFLSPIPFYLFLLALFGIMLLAWFVTKARWMRGLLLAGYVAAALYVIHPPFHYRPPVQPAPGHILLVPTQPRTFLQRIRWETHQDWFEVPGCRYTLLGWDEASVFYYSETCPVSGTKTWAFDPDEDPYPRLWQGPLPPLDATTQAPEAIAYVRTDTFPPSAEKAVRELTFRHQPWLLSPDGRWVATIAHPHETSEDVIVVSMSRK